jgi:elongation factor G
MKQIIWDDDSLGASFAADEISDNDKESAQLYRENLIERLAEIDDTLMEAYLSDAPSDSISTEQILSAIRKATVNLKLTPVLCGSALRNRGIQTLLDAIVSFLPSPMDIPAVKGVHPETGETITFPPYDKAPLSALIFKVSIMEGRKLSFVRVYSGKLVEGREIFNPGRRVKEQPARILMMHANKRERIEEAGAGNIVGVVGLKDSSTGETLCTPEHPILLERMEFYKPVISVAVEPKTHSDQERLDQILDKFLMEDPTLRVQKDEETGQTLLSGMGELHLEIIISRMEREFNAQVNVGKPQVVYRESIESIIEGSAVFDKEFGGQRHFGEVRLKLKPLPRGSGNRFMADVSEEAIPAIYIPVIEKAVMESFLSGVLMGYPVVDVEAILIGGSQKESLGSDLAYTVSASMACKEALSRGNPFLLEPIMSVEVLVPEGFTGDVIGDLNARNGKIEAIRPKTGYQAIRAIVPLAHMFGYSTSLRSATQGRGTFTMHFSHFDRC